MVKRSLRGVTPQGRCKPRLAQEQIFPSVMSVSQPSKPRRDAITFNLFRYKNGERQDLETIELKGNFSLSKGDFLNLAGKERFFIQLIINQFRFVIPFGYDNPRFFTSTFAYKQADVCDEITVECPDALQERMKQIERIEKKNQMIFTSDCFICGVPFSIGRPVLIDLDAIRSIEYTVSEGLSFIENGVGIRKLPAITY